MPNGRPGDHPLTDFLTHGYEVFPADIAGLIRQVYSLDPHAFECEDSTRRIPTLSEMIAESGDWHSWSEGKDLAAAEAFLRQKLEIARVLRVQRDCAADWIRDQVETAFAAMETSRLEQRMTFSLTHPAVEKRGLRIEHDLLYLCEGYEPDSIQLMIFTYPEPEVYLAAKPLRRFKSGDAVGLINFLESITRGELSLVYVEHGYKQVGATSVPEGEVKLLQPVQPTVEFKSWLRRQQ